MKGEAQCRVQELLAEGLSNKEIADRMQVTVRMVKWHVGNLYVKHGLYGVADQRRLIVVLVKEKLRTEKTEVGSHEADRRGGQHVHAGFSG
jgi:DNA-binding NarL/FixJ family response regulator